MFVFVNRVNSDPEPTSKYF